MFIIHNSNQQQQQPPSASGRQSRKLQDFLISWQISFSCRLDSSVYLWNVFRSFSDGIKSVPCEGQARSARYLETVVLSDWSVETCLRAALRPGQTLQCLLLPGAARSYWESSLTFRLRTVLTTQATKPAMGMRAITPTT